MKKAHEEDARIDRHNTAAAERATGKFWCASSAHFAAGEFVTVRGRKMCAACAAQRQSSLKAVKARAKRQTTKKVS